MDADWKPILGENIGHYRPCPKDEALKPEGEAEQAHLICEGDCSRGFWVSKTFPG
jgi:hypothetical protein